MIQSLGLFSVVNAKNGTATGLTDAKPLLSELHDMFDAVQEIAIYIHRFHNLDLFQQGWYQLKITMRWEDKEYASVGTPARVVQYEAPHLGADDVWGVWRIDDIENSFSTQPFRIKYARQDIRLCIMVSFNLSLGNHLGPPSSAVILKFELMQAPITSEGTELLAFLDAPSIAIHEFRIPPKALLGLHSYCPVQFDAFHAVLVDVSVHISMLKADYYAKVPSYIHALGDGDDGIYGFSQLEALGINESLFKDLAESGTASVDMQHIMLVKALLAARDILLEELQRLGKAIDQNMDLTEFTLQIDDIKMFKPILQANVSNKEGEVSAQGKPQNGFEKLHGTTRFRSDKIPHSLPKDAVLRIFNLLGSQMSYLWSTFLLFHRSNKIKILEFLRDSWAKDRRAEWSIWMVYSKVDMPHHYITSGNDDSTLHVHRRVSSLWKLPDDPAQSSCTRAELHRRSISHMRINNRSIQDMYIFGDPLRVPIIIVERVINAPRRTLSMNSYFTNVDGIDSPAFGAGPSTAGNKSRAETEIKPSNAHPQKNSRQLKIVVFVHGFQGHHLDLRLVRNQWVLIDPTIEYLMSEANEDKTSGDFIEMGQRLAREVVSFIKKKMDKVSRSCSLRDIKLSFVGHSMGNLILRTALADSLMEPYLRFLHTYVSLSGPHLGYLYSSNSLFNSGMWLLKKFKGTQCIHQLTFTDDPDIRNTFLYKLCEHKTLEYFQNIVLVSSPQDGYVPYHSARIESCQAASGDHSKRGRAFLEMLNNCMDQIRAHTFEQRLFLRFDINFDTSAYGRNFNTFIGRAAHIEFLESDIFAKLIMWSFPEVFR